MFDIAKNAILSCQILNKIICFSKSKSDFLLSAEESKHFLINSLSKNTLKGLFITLLSAFYEFIRKNYLKNFYFLSPNLMFFKKNIFLAATISFKLFSNNSLLKNTLKILVIIALLAFYDFMHKNSLLGALCGGLCIGAHRAVV